MISVAVRGYGIVIWEREGWRTFSTTDALSARLSARVEQALGELSPGTEEDDETVTAALLSIAGAHLLAVECDHGPGSPCRGDDDLN